MNKIQTDSVSLQSKYTANAEVHPTYAENAYIMIQKFMTIIVNTNFVEFPTIKLLLYHVEPHLSCDKSSTSHSYLDEVLGNSEAPTSNDEEYKLVEGYLTAERL